MVALLVQSNLCKEHAFAYPHYMLQGMSKSLCLPSLHVAGYVLSCKTLISKKQVFQLQLDGYKLSVLLTFSCVEEKWAILSFDAQIFEIHSTSITSQTDLNYLLSYICKSLCGSYFAILYICMQVSKVFS